MNEIDLIFTLAMFLIGVGLGVWFGLSRRSNLVWGLHKHIQHLKDINHQLRTEDRGGEGRGDWWKKG